MRGAGFEVLGFGIRDLGWKLKWLFFSESLREMRFFAENELCQSLKL